MVYPLRDASALARRQVVAVQDIVPGVAVAVEVLALLGFRHRKLSKFLITGVA